MDSIFTDRFNDILQGHFDKLNDYEMYNDRRIKELKQEINELESANHVYNAKKDILFVLMNDLNKLENELTKED